MTAILKVKDGNGNVIPIQAIKGEKGDKGDKGDRGLPGSGGVPDGGTTGQVLTKNSNADGDAGWKEPYTYVLPAATAQTLGGVKIGDGINIAEDGTISSEGGGSASAVLYTEQTLTDEQKTQALANIGGLSKSQGTANSGKFLGIGADGIVVPTEVGGSEDQLTGLELIVEHTVTEDENDATSLVFTQESYPKINNNKIFLVYITRTEVGTSHWLDIKAGTQLATNSSQCGNWNWMMFLADGTNGLWLKNWIYTTQSIDTYRLIEPAYYYGSGQIATKNIQFKPYDKITLSSWTAWFKTGMVIKIFGSKTT